jgi:hypothetical protein
MAIAIACGGLGLAGCDSTQQKNARARVVATRELDSRRTPHVEGRSQLVRVREVALVRGPRASAIVVALRSRAATALTDLPIVVGVRARDGRRTPLNAIRNLDWFQTHVPAVAAGGEATWVFVTRRPVARGVRPYARVGASTAAAVRWDGTLPQIAASAAGARDRRVRVALDNASDVPQYGLQVYAVARRGGRYVAAGKTAIRHLGTGERLTTSVSLVGPARLRAVTIQAIPTIFE